MTDTRLEQRDRGLRRNTPAAHVRKAADCRHHRQPHRATRRLTDRQGPAAPPADHGHGERRGGGWFEELVTAYAWAKILG